MVSARGGVSAAVEAPNWLAALGVGLDQFGDVSAIDRLACEVLMNGTVLARDARTGQGYVVRPLDVDVAEAVDEDETSELAFGGEDELPEDDDESEIISGGILEEDPSTEVGELPTGAVQALPAPVVMSEAPHDPVGALEAFDAEDASELPIDDTVTESFLVPTPSLVHGMADIANAVGVGPACEAALRTLQGAVAAESGSVLLLQPNRSLRFAVVTGPNRKKLTGSVLPPGAGIASFSLRHSTGVIVHHVGSDPRFYAEVDRLTGYVTDSILCVPIGDSGAALGCIQLLNPPSDRRFQTVDLRRAQDVAEALARQLRRKRLG